MMNAQYQIVTWNCHRAGKTSAAWDYLLGLGPDIVLLQEVGRTPEKVEHAYKVRMAHPRKKSGGLQRFCTALLVRGTIDGELILQSSYDWVNRELDYFVGNLPAFSVELSEGIKLNIICVYSPAWPVSPLRLKEVDVSGVKLSQNHDVWVTDLLWAALNHQGFTSSTEWVIAGDFNLSETFDQWSGGPRGNREYPEKMAKLGLVECLRHKQGKLTPTYKNPKGGKIVHQMDHLFVTAGMASKLIDCKTGCRDQVFNDNLSDHLPIIADFSS